MSPRNPIVHLQVRDRIPPKPQLTVRLEAHEMHWQILGRDGKIVKEGEQPIHNLVLNQAKNTLVATYGFSGLNSYACVGTGSTTPDASQTGLVAEVARTNAIPSGNNDASTRTANGVYEISRVRQFSSAQVGGQNLTEWGWSPLAAAGNNLMSRELFRDGSSNPITLTLASDQSLRLLYKTKVTIGPVTPQAISINIANLGVRTAQFVISKNRASTPAYYGDQGDLHLLEAFASAGGAAINMRLWAKTNSYTLGYNTNYADTPNPVGADIAYQAYVANSNQRKSQAFTFDVNTANFTIKTLALGYKNDPAGSGFYTGNAVIMFDSGQEIAKDNLHNLILDPWELNWL